MAAKFCSKCNEKFDDGVLFCKYCGLPTTRSEDEIPQVENKKSRKVVLSIAIAALGIVIIALFMIIEI
ncbi:zinc ribbon domain-containing protein [Cohnella luojiensis]|uniref:Zinc-ribbon domain-containing protein n=1 Tax=Cohnella luojiensis TaxID=652876 RepID=A0A4Y8M3S8_9BACL|nr:zinc ribbon domain-containing protein [Cohnella luojiensis]TFE26891.1 hypothetical protein E2980_10345 [Cohnella luojiensis]